MNVQVVPRSAKEILVVASGHYRPSPEVAHRFSPLHLGSGVVEASIRLVRTLAKIEATTRSPDLIVSLGLAMVGDGRAPTLYRVESIVETTACRDLAYPRAIESICSPLPPPALHAPAVAGLPTARLSACGFSDGDGRFPAASMVDPEGFAVAKVAEAYGIPAMILRGTFSRGYPPDPDAFHTAFLEACEQVLAAHSA